MPRSCAATWRAWTWCWCRSARARASAAPPPRKKAATSALQRLVPCPRCRTPFAVAVYQALRENTAMRDSVRAALGPARYDAELRALVPAVIGVLVRRGADDPRAAHPEQQVMLEGQFVYLLTGYSARDLSA